MILTSVCLNFLTVSSVSVILPLFPFARIFWQLHQFSGGYVSISISLEFSVESLTFLPERIFNALNTFVLSHFRITRSFLSFWFAVFVEFRGGLSEFSIAVECFAFSPVFFASSNFRMHSIFCSIAWWLEDSYQIEVIHFPPFCQDGRSSDRVLGRRATIVQEFGGRLTL